MPRATADAMLYEACILTGVPIWTVKLIYASMRINGGSHGTPAADLPPAAVAQ